MSAYVIILCNSNAVNDCTTMNAHLHMYTITYTCMGQVMVSSSIIHTGVGGTGINKVYVIKIIVIYMLLTRKKIHRCRMVIEGEKKQVNISDEIYSEFYMPNIIITHCCTKHCS